MTLPTPVAAAAALDVEDEAAVPEVAEPVVDGSFVALAEVNVASKLVALVHVGPAVLFDPDTNLTGAH